MKTKFYEKCDEAELLEAAQILKKGGLVAIPTETVYGLAANAYNGEAVSKVYEAKGRPTDNPMIVHISSLEEIYPLVTDFPDKAKQLASEFWPGPLTMILPKSDLVPRQVAPRLETVAVRMPSHPIARKIIELAGVPLAAPSANSSGSPSPTTAQHVLHDLDGKIDAVVDGGECDVGIESTVITLATDPPRLLRPGGITVDELASVLGHIDVDPAVLSELKDGVAPASPGMKYKHYSPKAEVYIVEGSLESFKFLIDSESEVGDMALCFNGEETDIPVPCLPFGDEGDLNSQAHLLFAELRRFDELGAKRVFVRAPSSEGVGLGVYNRLLRAAAFKVITPPVIYGLTGQTGAGKSTVAKMLEEKGYLVVDGDVAAREVVRKGSPVLAELAEAFDSDILDENGELIRSALAKKAFATEENRQKLNSITHPAVTKWSIDFIKKNLTKEHKGVVIDAAAIFDSDIQRYCTKMIVVTAPEEERLKRILERDGLTHEAAMLRIKAQKNEQYYIERADIIVRNYAPHNLAQELKLL
ncbi:MAG: threonylcarbamoyl-AMP synthase [Clostridia bacterium]|nr:threonylcarbamoyl-AMP synthase [Clostridia bacterium]